MGSWRKAGKGSYYCHCECRWLLQANMGAAVTKTAVQGIPKQEGGKRRSSSTASTCLIAGQHKHMLALLGNKISTNCV